MCGRQGEGAGSLSGPDVGVWWYLFMEVRGHKLYYYIKETLGVRVEGAVSTCIVSAQIETPMWHKCV